MNFTTKLFQQVATLTVLGGFLWVIPSALALSDEVNVEAFTATKTIHFKFTHIQRSGVVHYSVYCDQKHYDMAGEVGSVSTTEGLFPVLANHDVIRSIEISTQNPYCALLFYVDENGNNKLDRSRFLGLPKEGVGFSQLTSKPLSKPTWEATRFEMSSTLTMSAQVFYY